MSSDQVGSKFEPQNKEYKISVEVKNSDDFSVDLTKKFLWTSAAVMDSIMVKARKANTTKAGIIRMKSMISR